MATYKQLIELNRKRKENTANEISNNEALSESGSASIENTSNSSSRFNTLLSQSRALRNKERETEQAENAESNNARLNAWFSDAQKAFGSADSYLSNTTYSDMLNKSDTVTKALNSINTQSVWVEQYLKKYEGTEDGEPLVNAFKEYKNILNNYQSKANLQQEYAESFNDENEYNNALHEAKYANYSYDDLQNELNNFDENSEDYKWLTKKSNEVASSEESQKELEPLQEELDSLEAEYKELLKSSEENHTPSEREKINERLDYIEKTRPTLQKEVENKKRQVNAKTSEEQENQYNNAMLEKYGDYSYEQLFAEAKKFDDNSNESNWLKNAGYDKATSEELQNYYDKLKAQYSTDYDTDFKTIMNSNESDEYKAQEVTKLNQKYSLTDLENQISKKKQEERVTEFNNLDEETRNIISAKGNINYWSLTNWFGGDEDTKKAEENFNDLDMSKEDKNKYLETYNRMVESYNAELQHKAVQEQAESNPALASVISVGNNTIGAIPDAFKYIGATFSDDGYVNPRATNVSKAQTARATVSENMGAIGSFLYNTGMSMADFTVLLPLNLVPGGQAGSLAVMGTSAGVSSANTVIENGGDLNSAISTGLAAGIAEAFFEKFSLDQLKAFKVSGADSIKSAIFKNAFVEGSEEVGTDIANAITDQIINGDMSQLSQQYQNYIKQGYTEDEAWKLCAVDFGIQVGQSFAGGAVSGGVLSGGAIGLNYATNKVENSKPVVNNKVGKAVKENENVNSLIETAKKLSPESKAYKVAVQIEEQQKNNKKVSSSKVGQLRSLIIEQSQSEFDTEYKKVTENLHEDEKAVVDKLLNREALNEDEVKILNDNDVLKNSIADLQKKFNNLYSNAETADKAPFESIKSIDDNTDKIDESKLKKVSEDGKTKVNDEVYDGAMEVVRTNPFVETVTYKMEKNGEVIEVNSENIEFRTKEEAKLNALASKYNVQTAQKFFDLYESGQDVDEYSREFNIYQNYGRLAVPLDSEKQNIGYLLNNDQKMGAYEAGLTSRKSYYQEQNILSSNAKNSKYYAYTKGKFNASAIKGIQLDETQRAFYNFFREFALRTGINVELFSSKEKSGKYQGEQGSWNKNTKTIRVDINAGLMSVKDRAEIKHGMLNTFSHELTHIAELSGFYDELHEAIVNALEKRGTDFNELVKAKKDEMLRTDPKAKTMSDEKLTYLADVEVIANNCETMLKNSKIFEDIAQGNPTLAQKIKDKLKNFIARLKQLLNKTNALTHEGKLLEECVTEFENINRIWDKAVTDGIKTANAMHAEQKNNTADNRDVKNQLRSIPEEKEIAANIKTVANMKPVATLSGNEFSKSKTDLVTQVTDYFDEIGGYVNTEYGNIELTKSGVKSSIGHGIGRNKAIAFKAVPDVLKEGKIIDFQKNWKNRGYDTAVFAAPIKIADKDYFMAAVIVVEAERNSYYLHEVAIQEKEDNTLFKTGTVNNGTSGKVLSSPIFTLLQKLQSVKNESEDNTEYQSRTADIDNEYLEAVKNNDLETAQKLVDETAKENGYTIKAYHGTTNQQEKSTWNDKMKWYDTEYKHFTVFKKQYDEQAGHFFNDDIDNAGGYGSILYSVYLKINKPLVIDCNGQNYASITFDGKDMDTYEWAEYAKKHRYDGVIFKNISDGVGYDDLSRLTTDYVVFNSNQIKSSEPITYDDKGNVIPLSKRFINYSVDIRYQSRNTKPDYNFSKALSYREWSSFYSSVEKSNQRNSFRIGNYGVIIPDEKNPDNYKLVYYDGDSVNPSVKAVYKLENYDYNIHDEQFDFETILKALEGKDESEEFAETVLDNCKSVYGTIFRKYEAKSCKFINISRKYNKTLQHNSVEPDRTGTIENTEQGISDSGINDNIEYQSRSSLSYDRDLVAIHNLSAENLLKSINLGGFAMPSIAITKSELQHNDYGKISLIFSKDTIDPETDRSNEVYSGDAWTPTFPKIEYKINERKSSKIYDKLYNLFKDNNIERLFSGLDIDDNNIEYYINNRSNWIQTYRDKSEMKLAYLLDTGNPINMPYKESRLSAKYENDVIINVANTLGFDIVEKGLEYSTEAIKLTDKINSIVDEYYSKEVGKSIHFDLSLSDIDSILRGAYKYLKHGNNKEIDTYALEEEIKKADIDEKDYYKWIDNLFDGIIEKKGLRNNRDLFTSSGNRRSFESLHYEVTLENVVKAMKDEDKKGAVGLFGGSQFYGSSTKNYNSVNEIKKNKSRLQSLSEDEYDKIRYGFNERLSEICKELNPDAENSFMEVDRTASILCEAVKSRKTKAGIKRYLSEYQQLTVNDEIVDKIISLVNDIRQMPVKYFEAKPRRAVSFDEVKAAVIPVDTDNAVKEALKELGVPMYEYDSNDENNRAEVTQKAINTEYVDVNGEKHSDLLFQMRTDNGFANRRLLANALEKSAQNNYEKNKVKLYKENIDRIDELEARLDEVNEKIKKASSVKAAERTREQRTELMKLNNVKKILQDKIVRKDKQLLNFESMDVMKKLIESEKKKAKHEARINYEAKLKDEREKHNAELASVKERDKERLAKVRESKDKIIVAEREKRKTMVKGIREARDKKEIIRKTIKKIKDIDKLLNRSKADKTVKQGLRDTASKLLSLKDILLDTNLSNADIVRRGIEIATPDEQKLLKEYLSIIGETDTELSEVQRRKVYQLNSKLKDLFIRERERLNRATVKQALTELSETYKSVENAPEAYLRNSFDKNIIEAIDNLKEEIGGTLVKDMNVEQVQELHDIVTMILTSIRNANKHFAENIKTTCEETSSNVMNEILSVKGTKEVRNLLANKILDFQWRNLKPIYAFRLMGSKTFEKIYWNLQKGELDWYIDIAEAKQFKEECEEKYGYKSFDFKKTFEFTAMDGSTFTLDLNQMMDIYAASRRTQALQHLLKGGFTFEKDSADGKLKVKTGAKAYPLTMSTIQSIANGLSENEKGYAEEMQKYLSEVMAKKGNEVSMALYGVEMFNEDTYWSISSSDTFLKVEENETTGEFKVKNFSFTKSTIRNASNPIVLRGFEENWCNHVNQMSLYHAMTLPLEDFTKIFNYNTGVRTNEENPTAVTGVRSVIKGAFGNSAEHYFRQFIRDLNGGIREASRVGIADNMIALSKKAAVFANFSVFLQQPSAIFRAWAYVDKRYFLPEPNKLVRLQNHHKDWEQLKKYAPIAGIKEMGMFDTGTGKGVLEWLSSGKRDSVVKKTQNKIDDVGSWLPAKADEYAWVKLWHAIQRETRVKYGLAVGTEENLIKSGERFNEVVHLTQVYDSVFSRSGAMRSSQTFDKMATSFMAEPTTIMNMAVDAVVQLKRNGKSGIRQFAKSASAILISIFANTLLKSVITAGRDDDEDETYSDKYWQAFCTDLINSAIPLNYYPIMRDLVSVIEGYTTERMDMSLVSDFVVSLKKLLKEDGATANNLIDFVGYIANLFGLPVRNVIRDVRAVFNTYNTLTTASKDPITSLEMSMPADYQETYDKYWKEGYTEEDCKSKAASSVKAKIRKKLKPVYLEALKNQDSATVANIRRYMRDSGFYNSLNDVDEVLKGWRESSEEEEERAQRAEERK